MSKKLEYDKNNTRSNSRGAVNRYYSAVNVLWKRVVCLWVDDSVDGFAVDVDPGPPTTVIDDKVEAFL